MANMWSSSGSDLHLDWRPGSGRRGLADALRQAIRDGRLAPGAAVPSTRSLAADLRVARGTVTRIYADLAAEGYLRTQQGAPTRVATAAALAGGALAGGALAGGASAGGASAGGASAGGLAASVLPASVLPPGRPQRPDPGRPALPPGPAARWDLYPGRPDLSSFPGAVWLSAARRVLQQAPTRAFDYGDPRGAAGLREALARYLARSRGVLADPEHIVVCGGFRHAITVLTLALARQGVDEIAFEDPSLPHLREAPAAAGLRVTGVAVDGSGAQLTGLGSGAVVLTPSHQFPLGVTMSPGRRREVVSWAARTGGFVIEDDYDGEFRFDRTPVGALQGLAPDRVVYAGTASKALAPALRLAWLVLPRALLRPVREAIEITGWRPPVIDHLILADLMDSGAYDRHVRQRRAAYRRRRDRLLAALPSWAVPAGIAAGLHLLVMLPDPGPAEADVLAAARRRGVAVDGLGRYWMNGGPGGLVVGYATPPDHAFGPALDALVASLRAARRRCSA